MVFKPRQEWQNLDLKLLISNCAVQQVKEATGHEIAPNTVANATKIIVLATKIHKLVAKLATRIL